MSIENKKESSNQIDSHGLMKNHAEKLIALFIWKCIGNFKNNPV